MKEDSIHVHHVIRYVIIVSFHMKGAKRSIKRNPPSFTVHSSQSRIIPQRETSCDHYVSLKFYFSRRSYVSAALVSLSFNPTLTSDFLHPSHEGGWVDLVCQRRIGKMAMKREESSSGEVEDCVCQQPLSSQFSLGGSSTPFIL